LIENGQEIRYKPCRGDILIMPMADGYNLQHASAVATADTRQGLKRYAPEGLINPFRGIVAKSPPGRPRKLKIKN